MIFSTHCDIKELESEGAFIVDHRSRCHEDHLLWIQWLKKVVFAISKT